jgi:serine/threonine protein kinase
VDDELEDSLFEPPSAEGVVGKTGASGESLGFSDAGEPGTVLSDSAVPKPPDGSRVGTAPASKAIVVGNRGSYRLERVMGSGGMGMIWKGQTMVLEEGGNDTPSSHSGGPIPDQVAVKFVKYHGATAQEASQIVRRELSPLLGLRSERVVPLVDWSLEGDHPFLVFEFFSNGSLKDLLDDDFAGRGMDGEGLLQLAEDLLIAVNGAHRSALLHLDIKPGNILLDGSGGYLLADFGIAQEFGEGRLQELPGLGTRAFQAPEQAARAYDAFDQRTDLFGVGMTLYAAAVGVPSAALLEEREAYRYGRYAMPDLRHRRADLPLELSTLIMHLIRNQRRKRPGHAGEVRERVRAIRDGNLRVVEEMLVFPGREVTDEEADTVIEGLISGAWRQLLIDRPPNGRIIALAPGEVLYHEGDNSFSAFVLLSGTVEALLSGRIVAQFGRLGELIGESAALIGHPRGATVRAVEDCYLLAFNAAEFESFVTSNPMVAKRLLRALCERCMFLRSKLDALDDAECIWD